MLYLLQDGCNLGPTTSGNWTLWAALDHLLCALVGDSDRNSALASSLLLHVEGFAVSFPLKGSFTGDIDIDELSYHIMDV